MEEQYYYSITSLSILQILAVYMSKGLASSYTEDLYLIPINPVHGILSSAGRSAPGFEPGKAVDYTQLNSKRTYWRPLGLPAGSSNYFIVFDFGTIHLVTKLHIIHIGDNVHDVTSFKLESSNNSQNWTEVAQLYCQPGTNSKQKFGGFVSINRYWKFTITNTISGLEPWLVEVGFYGTRISIGKASNGRIDIGNFTEVEEIRRSIEKSLQRSRFKNGIHSNPDVLIHSRERSRSLKDPVFKYKHNIPKRATTEIPLDDLLDETDENTDETINVTNSEERSRSLKEPTFKYYHNISRIPKAEVPLDDVNDEVIDKDVNDTVNVMEYEESSSLAEQTFRHKQNNSRTATTNVPLDDVIDDVIDEESISLNEPTSRYKHNHSRITTFKAPLDDVIDEVMDDETNENQEVRNANLEEHTIQYNSNFSDETSTELYINDIDNVIGESTDDPTKENSKEIVPMTGTTKLISHMHVTSLDTNMDSFEDFFQLIGISQKDDAESGKISSNVIQVEKGPSRKYMTWLYLTLGLVILGIILVAMGCVILQLIKRQNKLLASAIEFNRRPGTCSKTSRPHRHNHQCKMRCQGSLHKDIQSGVHQEGTLPVTPV